MILSIKLSNSTNSPRNILYTLSRLYVAFIHAGGKWRARGRKFAIARERNMRIMPSMEKYRSERVIDLYVLAEHSARFLVPDPPT